MMNATMVSGTGRQAALPDQIAGGKTGTSQNSRDAWFVGYTAHYVGGVWVGNDDGSKMRNVTGGTLPAHICGTTSWSTRTRASRLWRCLARARLGSRRHRRGCGAAPAEKSNAPLYRRMIDLLSGGRR